MNIFKAGLAVALASATLCGPAAIAQGMNHDVRSGQMDPNMRHDNTDIRRDRTDMRHDGDMRHSNMGRDEMMRHRGWSHNRGWSHHHGWARNCWMTWRHHHKVRVCR